MRKLEKISLKQFIKDTDLTKTDYENYHIPKRSTQNSAGYDFELVNDMVIKPKEIKLIPTGIKAQMNKGEVLFIFIRSSLGFKYNIRMCNQVGIIDGDYYNNSNNEGHIFIKIQNEGEKEVILKKRNRIAQGIFTKYLTVDDEQEIKTIRNGGIGSTNKEV